MKKFLFEYPCYEYIVDDWQLKKRDILRKIENKNFIRTDLQNFETDRFNNNREYLAFFEELILPELQEFCLESQTSCRMTDCWTVKYKKGDYQNTHNHRSWGFSGVLYLQYDPEVHTPTYFICPWQDPRMDTSSFSYPKKLTEGTILIFPSQTLHFVNPNQSEKERIIISFDLLPQ